MVRGARTGCSFAIICLDELAATLFFHNVLLVDSFSGKKVSKFALNLQFSLNLKHTDRDSVFMMVVFIHQMQSRVAWNGGLVLLTSASIRRMMKQYAS